VVLTADFADFADGQKVRVNSCPITHEPGNALVGLVRVSGFGFAIRTVSKNFTENRSVPVVKQDAVVSWPDTVNPV
jgi:hypothetical protein